MTPHTQEELHEIALAVFQQRIFTNRHCEPHDVGHVFMPLLFMEESELKELVAALGEQGTLYEFMTEASPVAVNGMPTFFSVRVLNDADSRTMWSIYTNIVEAIEATT